MDPELTHSKVQYPLMIKLTFWLVKYMMSGTDIFLQRERKEKGVTKGVNVYE